MDIVWIVRWLAREIFLERRPPTAHAGKEVLPDMRGPVMPKTRRQTKAGERRNRHIHSFVSRAELKAYQEAAAKGFNGSLAAFLRAAADALAAEIESSPSKITPLSGARSPNS
jgi:hypothetical protein